VIPRQTSPIFGDQRKILVWRLTVQVYTGSASGRLEAVPLEIPEIINMLYIEKGVHMRIDAAMPQTQRINEMAAQPQKEVAGEREPDGDADDRMKVAAKTPSASQISPQGVGSKVDLFA
jgi:hypothetical protein